MRTIADTGGLIVVLDFDGVLAPLVDDPAASRPLPAAVTALTALLDREVPVAIVSGRALAELREVTAAGGLDPRVRLVGGHGGEWGDDEGPAGAPGPAFPTLGESGIDEHRYAQTATVFDEVSARHTGTRVERKPGSLVLHTRGASPAQAAAARAELAEALAPGVKLMTGHDVLEAMLTHATKGAAVDRLRASAHPQATVFFAGDDVTDESAFARLRAGDLGVKVGPGPTAAGARVADPGELAEVLALLAAHPA